MIQRIQTIYLLLVTGLLITAMCLPSGYFIGKDAIYTLSPSGVDVAGAFYSTWGVLAVLILAAIISFATIFLFKNRMLQIRMTVFNIIIIAGYYLSFFTFMFMLKKETATDFQIAWALCLPFIAIVLNYLAIRAIGKDEVMVKAADRIR